MIRNEHFTVANNDFVVLAFSSKNYGLSQDYQFVIHVDTEQSVGADLCVRPLMGQAAILEINHNTKIHGVVTEIKGHAIIMHSPLHPMTQKISNRVYLQKDITGLVQEILQYNGWNKNDYELRITDKYYVHEIFIQRNEFDYDFLRRHLDHFGLFFTFLGAKLIITDDMSCLPDWQGKDGDIINFRAQEYTATMNRRLLTQSVKLRDYNPDAPEQELIAAQSQQNSDVSGFGCHYLYGENYASLEEGRQLAKVRVEALDWQRQTLELKTNYLDLTPGLSLTLTNHPKASYNGKYRVIKLQVDANSPAAAQTPPLLKGGISMVTLIKAEIPYRNPITKKIMRGLQIDTIESSGGNYASLDQQGRYQVQGQETNLLRLMQPYSGRDYGMHFPLHQHVEVLCANINGDPDRPLLLGTLPSTNNPSPATSKNFWQNILRTRGGNELLMDDKKGQAQFKLFTKDEQSLVHLDATDNNNKIELTTKTGSMNIVAGKSKLQESETDNIFQAGKDHVVHVTNLHKVQTKQQDIKFQSGKDIKLKAKQDINIKGKNVSLKSSKNTVINTKKATINAKQNIIVDNAKGSTYFKADHGININTKNLGTIILKQGNSKIEIDPEGNITFQALQINIGAKKNNLQGQHLNIAIP